MKKILTLKNWELFILMCAIPILCSIIAMSMIFTTLFERMKDSITTMKVMSPDEIMVLFNGNEMLIVVASFSVFALVYLAWIWTLIMESQQKLPAELSINLNWFKVVFFVFLIFSIIKAVAAILVFGSFMESNFLTGKMDVNGNLGTNSVALFAVVCICYLSYCTAKVFKTVQLRAELKFGQFIEEFFLLWFYPVGVWIIQPKINKMMKE